MFKTNSLTVNYLQCYSRKYPAIHRYLTLYNNSLGMIRTKETYHRNTDNTVKTFKNNDLQKKETEK